MGNTHRQSKKALTPLQKGLGGARQSTNNQLPDFPLKRDDSDLIPEESEMALSNISLTQEEMMARSRGNVGLVSQRESGGSPYSPVKHPVSDHDENDSTNAVSFSSLSLFLS
jgi:hypothetical protein